MTHLPQVTTKPIFKTLLSLGDFHSDRTPFFSAEVTIKLTSRKLTDVIGWESWAKFIKKLHNVNIMSHVKVITLSRKWVHHMAWMNYHTSDYIIACIDTFNAEVTHVSQVITLSHTLLHSTQKWQHNVTQVTILLHTLYIQHRSDYIMSHKWFIIRYINTFNTEVITFNTEVITLCHTSDYRGGSRGRVQGVRTPTWDDLRFSNTTGILQKKKLCGLLV